MYALYSQDFFGGCARDERGNMFVLFGASAIPLLLIMGGAVDFARYERYKDDLSNAVDSASLALARQHPTTRPRRRRPSSRTTLTSMIADRRPVQRAELSTPKARQGLQVTANGSMQTMFLPLGRLTKSGHGIDTMGVNVTAQVVNSSARLEVALVIDNTGSMNCGPSVSRAARRLDLAIVEQPHRGDQGGGEVARRHRDA